MEIQSKYITVRYSCSNKLARKIYEQYDIEDYAGCFVCINHVLDDDKKFFIDFNTYYRPKYKKLIFINLQNIRKLYEVNHFNFWMRAVDMFDEIWDVHEQLEEYRPSIQPKVKHIDVETDEEIDRLYRFMIGVNGVCDVYGDNIGDHTTFHPTTLRVLNNMIPGQEKLYMGRFCSIGERVEFIINRDHDYKCVTSSMLSNKYIFPWKPANLIQKGDIVIGNDVWIGMDVRILHGVTIGDGAVIGAGAIVTNDIPPYAIVAGNPAKLIKYRFSQDIIDKLLKIQWWNWPLYKVYDNMSELDSRNVEDFINKFE